MKVSDLTTALSVCLKLVAAKNVIAEFKSGMMWLHTVANGSHAKSCLGTVKVEDSTMNLPSKLVVGLMSGHGINGDDVVALKKMDSGLQMKFGGLKAAMKQIDELDLQIAANDSAVTQTVGTFLGLDLKNAFAAVAEFASKNDVRFYLRGVYLGITNGKLDFVATDGVRIAELQSTLETSLAAFAGDVIIPAECAIGLAQVINEDDQIEVSILGEKDARLIKFKSNSFELVSPLMSATYPNYKAVMAAKNAMSLSVEVSRKSLVAAIKRISLMGDKFVFLKIQPVDGCVIVESFDGESLEKIDAQPTLGCEESISIAFNPTLLGPTIDGANSDIITLMANPAMGANSHVGVARKDDSSWFALCMPCRV